MAGTKLDGIVSRLVERRAAEEAEEQERERERREEREVAAWSRSREQHVLDLIVEVVAEVNARAPAPVITEVAGREVTYRAGARTLNVRFFRPGELYENPKVPGRMNHLHDRRATHGGYIGIQENSQGWNLVLLQTDDDAGSWLIVETDLSPFSGRAAQYPPIATQAQLFADNLACHWGKMTHIFQLEDRPLDRDDIIAILDVFAG